MPKPEFVLSQAQLIETGKTLPAASETEIYSLPVRFSGFENLKLVGLQLSDPETAQSLIPRYTYQPYKYVAQRAVCVLENGEPLVALLEGVVLIRGEVVTRQKVVSIANLCEQHPGRIILKSNITQSLHNDGVFGQAGYPVNFHEPALKGGAEVISIAKKGDRVVISFPQNG